DIDWSLGRKGELHAKGSWLGRVIEGHLVTHLYRLTDAVTGVHARDCSFRAAQEKALSLDVQCLAHADFRPVRALGPAAPERLTGEVKASVRLSGKKMSGAVDVALVPFFLSVAEGKGSVSVAME